MPKGALARLESPLPITGDVTVSSLPDVTIGSPIPLPTEDTGENTNPEKYRQEYGGSFGELVIVVAGAAGQQVIRITPPDPAGERLVYRLKEVTIRHTGTNDAVVTVQVTTEALPRLSLDVRSGTTREWESEIGRVIGQTLTVVARSSDVTGGTTYISGSYLEANV